MTRPHHRGDRPAALSRVFLLLVLAALLGTSCSGSSSGAPVSSPTAQVPQHGIVGRPLCLTLRTSIQANLQTLAKDRDAGDDAAAAAVQAKVDADVASARRIPGCSVDDLLSGQ